jgi:hypothetical protein
MYIETAQQFLVKFSNINASRISLSLLKLFHAYGQTDRQKKILIGAPQGL